MSIRLLEPGQGGEHIREIPIGRDEFLMGRGSDCDLRVHDTAISRQHCLIRVRDQEVTITDLGSSNGTFVNGTRVLSQIALHTGDEIQIGPSLYLVDLGDDPDWAEKQFGIEPNAKSTTLRMPPKELAKKLNLGGQPEEK
jgi:pSer/pThr/pTyr-binding forkhead associated (FHA) protein